MKPHVHYEAAFEDYLRQRQTPYVAVQEARQALYLDTRLKSFDFIVYSAGPLNWLTDVKGRRWGPRPGQRRPTWENWITQGDLDGLTQWQRVFGSGFRALLVFAYWISPAAHPPPELLHEFRAQRYLFTGVRLDDYRLHARIRSPRWGTVNMPRRDFAAHVRPLADWL